MPVHPSQTLPETLGVCLESTKGLNAQQFHKNNIILLEFLFSFLSFYYNWNSLRWWVGFFFGFSKTIIVYDTQMNRMRIKPSLNLWNVTKASMHCPRLHLLGEMIRSEMKCFCYEKTVRTCENFISITSNITSRKLFNTMKHQQKSCKAKETPTICLNAHNMNSAP